MDRTAFLNSPVMPTGLFGSAVHGFTECFTAVQKTSRAMRHFLPKRSSSAAVSSHQKAALTQQPAKPAQSQSKPELELRQRPQPTPFLNTRAPEAILIRQERRGEG